jgi:glutamyl-tRNA reductase
MQLLCLSVSHHTASVKLRECLSLPTEVLESAFTQHPFRMGPFEPINEMVVLSTCNRLEVYALVAEQEGVRDDAGLAFQFIFNYLDEVLGIPTAEIEPYFRAFSGIHTVEHLYQVAAGLDSIAIGENQILGQVARALEIGLRLGSARHVLSSLFRSAIHAGKRVRKETEIGRRPTSISTIAIQLAETNLGSLADSSVLVIGAGKMGAFALEILKERGMRQIMLVNRTQEHAVDLMKRLGVNGQVLTYDCLVDGLAEVDLVFTSTSSQAPVLWRELIEQVMASRPQRPLMLLDLAVPRNVAMDVKEIPNVYLYDMDDFQAYVKATDEDSYPAIAQANAIVAQEVAAYDKLLHIIPFIGELHRKVELIRQREVEKTLRHLAVADPKINQQIEIFSRALVRKILHEPTMHLRSESDQETLNDYVDTLAKLFDLAENEDGVTLQKGE